MSGFGKNVAEGDDENLLLCMVDTFPTSHLLTSLLNFTARRNTARREEVRIRIRTNVAEGDDETAEEGMNTYLHAW